MKKTLFLSIIGAIAIVMNFISCNQAKKNLVVNGITNSVDTFVVNHYSEHRIEGAISRDVATRDIIFPTDASSFGQKKAEVRWRAFDEDMQAVGHVREVGKVIVVHYEHGLEIIKDGQSWFYDGFEYDEDNLIDITAGISVLHRPRWEPVTFSYKGSLLVFEYSYPIQCQGQEWFSIGEDMRYDLNISNRGDVLDNPHAIKKY